MHSGIFGFIWILIGESGAGAAGGGARSAALQLALLGMLIALIGLGALIVWTMLRWLRLRMEARANGVGKGRGKGEPVLSAWAQAGQRIGGDRTPTPWPSIANPNLQDPISRILEREVDDDSLEETRPMDSDPDLDDTDNADTTGEGLHDTDEEHRWEFEGGEHEEYGDEDEDEDPDEDTGFGDESIGFDGDDTDDPDDTDDDDDPEKRERW